MDIADILKQYSQSLKDTQQIIQVLGTDCDKHYKLCHHEDDQLHRRAYVRSVFAFIEGIVHHMKETASRIGFLFGHVNAYERTALDDVKVDIDAKGNITTKPLHPTFLNNIRFTFKISAKTIGSSFTLQTGGGGWEALRKALEVRNRLMHPKDIHRLEVTADELKASKKAFDWFLISHALCSLYAEKAVKLQKDPVIPEEIDALDKHIASLEKELKEREKR
jgi:hypothetical protein